MDIKITIPDIKKNDFAQKRMDTLERKLDQQYKNRIEGRDITKEISSLQTSFMKKLNKFMDSNKSLMTKQNDKLAEALKKVVNRKVEVIKTENTSKPEIKSFMSKIGSLENAIKGITLKAKNNVPHNGNGKLDKSFEKFFSKMEKLIEESKPRMYPSPS